MESIKPLKTEYFGPKVTPLVLFAAMAPECPANFTWSNPEPEPKVPSYTLLSDELRQIDQQDPDGDDWPPELVDFYAQRKAATEARDSWKRRDEYGRQVAWRWFYAQLMMQALPTPALAPQVTASPLLDRALEAFAIERARQVYEKGYQPEHDDAHADGALAAAAAWYAIPAQVAVELPDGTMNRLWPKGWSLPEPTATTHRKRELEKAGALLAAEWDRLDRLEKAG